MGFGSILSLFNAGNSLRRGDPSFRDCVVDRSLQALCVRFRKQAQMLSPHSNFSPHALIQHFPDSKNRLVEFIIAPFPGRSAETSESVIALREVFDGWLQLGP